jgi:hypothetical protein
VAGVRFEIQPCAARTAPFLLLSENMAVAVNPAPPRGLPTLAIELRSIFLWQLGAHGAHDVALAVGDELADRQPLLTDGGALGPATVPLAITRVDLTLDFQGWTPPSDPTAYTTRASRITPHYDRGKFTGLSIGRGALMARIYDKTLELRSSGKDWFFDVWRRAPQYDATRPVWRLEFQLRRVGLRSFRLGRNDKRINDFWELAPAAGELWRHCTSRWLALKTRSSRTRHLLDPAWSRLHSGGFADGVWNGNPGNLYRLARETSSSRCLGQLTGYAARFLASEGARTGEKPNLDSMGPRLLAAVRRHGERSGQPVDAKAARLIQDWTAAEHEARGLVEPAAASDEREPDDDLDP